MKPRPQRQSRIHAPRIVVVESVYHQQGTDSPTVVDCRFNRWLETEGSPFSYKGSVKDYWEVLPSITGANSNYSMLVLKNTEGRFTGGQPTQQERDSVMSRILEIGLEVEPGRVVHFSRIPAGESARFCPSSFPILRLRSPNGPTRYLLTLFPS